MKLQAEAEPISEEVSAGTNWLNDLTPMLVNVLVLVLIVVGIIFAFRLVSQRSRRPQDAPTGSNVEGLDDDLRWFSRRGMIRYVPGRFQPLVFSILASLLFFNAFTSLTESRVAPGACGSLLRPVVYIESETARIWKGADDYTRVGWIWNIASDLSYSACPELMSAAYWEVILSFGALFACGFVLRRSIRRDS